MNSCYSDTGTLLEPLEKLLACATSLLNSRLHRTLDADEDTPTLDRKILTRKCQSSIFIHDCWKLIELFSSMLWSKEDLFLDLYGRIAAVLMSTCLVVPKSTTGNKQERPMKRFQLALGIYRKLQEIEVLKARENETIGSAGKNARNCGAQQGKKGAIYRGRLSKIEDSFL